MSTFAKTLSLISALFMLTACGGGGSVSREEVDNGGGGTPAPDPTTTYTISLTLENASGASDNNLTQDNSLVIVANVTDQNGDAHANALLTFPLATMN